MNTRSRSERLLSVLFDQVSEENGGGEIEAVESLPPGWKGTD